MCIFVGRKRTLQVTIELCSHLSLTSKLSLKCISKLSLKCICLMFPNTITCELDEVPNLDVVIKD